MQELSCVYDCNCAIKNGTIFPELNKPFLGKRGCCG
ncbi:MAG: spore coat associated protein CotJA [Spirochaetaceae bacterium]|nr:spore coat associated protein CotJA [Spirochaetaceae bacterium]